MPPCFYTLDSYTLGYTYSRLPPACRLLPNLDHYPVSIKRHWWQRNVWHNHKNEYIMIYHLSCFLLENFFSQSNTAITRNSDTPKVCLSLDRTNTLTSTIHITQAFFIFQLRHQKCTQSLIQAENDATTSRWPRKKSSKQRIPDTKSKFVAQHQKKKMHIPQPLASPQVLTNSAKSALLAQKSTLFMEKLLQSVCSQRRRRARGCSPTFYY